MSHSPAETVGKDLPVRPRELLLTEGPPRPLPAELRHATAHCPLTDLSQAGRSRLPKSICSEIKRMRKAVCLSGEQSGANCRIRVKFSVNEPNFRHVRAALAKIAHRVMLGISNENRICSEKYCLGFIGLIFPKEPHESAFTFPF